MEFPGSLESSEDYMLPNTAIPPGQQPGSNTGPYSGSNTGLYSGWDPRPNQGQYQGYNLGPTAGPYIRQNAPPGPHQGFNPGQNSGPYQGYNQGPTTGPYQGFRQPHPGLNPESNPVTYSGSNPGQPGPGQPNAGSNSGQPVSDPAYQTLIRHQQESGGSHGIPSPRKPSEPTDPRDSGFECADDYLTVPVMKKQGEEDDKDDYETISLDNVHISDRAQHQTRRAISLELASPQIPQPRSGDRSRSTGSDTFSESQTATLGRFPVHAGPAKPALPGYMTMGGVQAPVPAPRPAPVQAPVQEIVTSMPWFWGDMTSSAAGNFIHTMKKDGSFLVRYSSPEKRGEYPYSLTLLYKKKVYHLCVRRINNILYALGYEKANEILFPSVSKLIDYYKQQPVILAGGDGKLQGKVKLTQWPPKR